MTLLQAEADASWWFASRDGELGQAAQSYDFAEPRAALVDSWGFHERLVSPRRRISVNRYYRILPAMCALDTASRTVLSLVYTPHGWGDSMAAVRLAMGLGGARHTTNLTGLLPQSHRLAATRDRNKPGEGLLDHMRWVVSQRNENLVRAIRDELSGVLEDALTLFDSARRSTMSSRAAHVAWASETFGSAAAAE